MASNMQEEKIVDGAAPHQDAKSNINQLERSASKESVQVPDITPVLHWRTWMVVFAASFTYTGQVCIVAGTGFWRGNISSSVGGADVDLWVSQAFQIVNAVAGPPLARIIGRKWVVLVGCIFGVLGVSLIAAAKTMTMAIVGSVLFGFYWAMIGATCAICSEVLPRRFRGSAQILYQAWGTAGQLLATLGGAGFIVHQPGGYEGWRSFFWLVVGLLAFGGVFFLVAYHPPATPNPSNRSYLDRILDFDKLGTVLWGLALIPFMMALIWGGGQYAWSSAPVISTLVVGLVFMIIFGLHQTFWNKEGLFHHNLFQNRNFIVVLVGLFVEGMVYITYTNYFGEETAILYDHSTLGLALRFNVFTIGQYTGYPIFAYWVHKTREPKWPMFFGFLCFLGANIGLAVAKEHDGNVTLGCSALAGLGFAAPITLMQAAIQLAVKVEFIGAATALAYTARSVGGAVGVAIATAVFNSKSISRGTVKAVVPVERLTHGSVPVKVALPHDIAAAGIAAGVPATAISDFVGGIASSNTTLLDSITGITPAMIEAGGAAALHAYAHSFSYVWIVQTPFIVCAAVATVIMKSSKNEMNALIDRPIEPIHHKEHVDNVVHEVQETRASA